MGRPKLEIPEDVTDIHHVPQEEHYIGVKDKFLPFSTSIRADLYLLLKRAEYHEKVKITKIINEVLEANLKKRPSTSKPLPEKEAAKMKSLITNKYYYWKKIAKTEER